MCYLKIVSFFFFNIKKKPINRLNDELTKIKISMRCCYYYIHFCFFSKKKILIMPYLSNSDKNSTQFLQNSSRKFKVRPGQNLDHVLIKNID